MNYVSRSENHVLIKKIASTNPEERIAALNRIDKVLLEKANTTGEARKYFKGLSATDTEGEGMRIITPEHDMYDDKTWEKPGVMYYMQPDPDKEIFSPKPRAVAMGPDAASKFRTFAGLRYTETFERIAGDEDFKSINELYVYPYDIVGFFENFSLKVLMDLESVMFFRLINALLSLGRTELANKNIMVANKDTFSFYSFSTLKDQHKKKQVPFSRIIGHFELFNEKERTVASEMELVGREGANGESKMDTIFGMTPLTLQTMEYCYYSFNKSLEDLEDEHKQFFINLDDFTCRNVAEVAAISDEPTRNAEAETTKVYMENMGYKFTAPSDATARYGTGYEFAQYLDADNFLPRIPIHGEDYEEAVGASKDPIVSILGKSMMRTIVLTPRAYFGHFDLFNEDAKTVVEKNRTKISFCTEEEMIMTAKNKRAATVLDVWIPVKPYVGS